MSKILYEDYKDYPFEYKCFKNGRSIYVREGVIDYIQIAVDHADDLELYPKMTLKEIVEQAKKSCYVISREAYNED